MGNDEKLNSHKSSHKRVKAPNLKFLEPPSLFPPHHTTADPFPTSAKADGVLLLSRFHPLRTDRRFPEVSSRCTYGRDTSPPGAPSFLFPPLLPLLHSLSLPV